jgi:hypothetical protein
MHTEELHNFYSSPSIIRMVMGRACSMIGSRGTHIGFWLES